jgi:S1-C subfamily serine protease
MLALPCSTRAIRPGLWVVFALSIAALSTPAHGQALPADKLKAVKDATVLLRVTLPNGQLVTGSGFFADSPGLVITNAHVLGMLDPDSRKPAKVQVVVRSGEANAQTLTATVLGVDRGTDLGVVRVEGKDLPAPLKPVSASELTETEEVYAFGFPFGDRLGKNITVAKTSVSSLRKTAGGNLDKIQVNGGIHPGNSGGPVIDTKGRLVGIAVSGLRNTQIHFAIPADRLSRYLAGRIASSEYELPYRDGDKVKQTVRAGFLDPLGRIQKMEVECFVGPEGPRGAADKQPPPQPGDTPIKTYTLKYDAKTGQAVGDIELPPLPSPKHRYFVRPVVTDGDGKTRWYGTSGEGPKLIMDRVAADLTFRPAVAVTPAEVVSIGSFKIRDPNDEEYSLGLNLRFRYRERAGEPDRKLYPVRLEPTGFAMTVMRDGKPVPGTADTKVIGRDTQFFSALVGRDEEGQWVQAKPDVSKVPAQTRDAVEDIGMQFLQSLEATVVPLPNREVKPLETWKSRREVTVGAASMSMTMTGLADYRYTYLGTTERNGKKVLFVRIEGTIRGKVGAGSDIGGSIDGRAEIDPATGEATYSDVTLKADADITFRKETLKTMGTLQVQCRRGDLPPPTPPKK